MGKFRVVERFISINGEGARAGQLSVFIRFQGCNLDCSYCDTQYANRDDTPVTEMTTEEIIAYAQKTGIRNITLTGGEPLLQEGVEGLVNSLGNLGFQVEIETNGSVWIDDFKSLPFKAIFNMDYKLPSSGMEDRMVPENFMFLRPKDCVKFVIGAPEDLPEAEKIIRTYALTARCRVYFMPVFGEIDPAIIVDYMKERKLNGVRMHLQLQKYIWKPETRGV